MSYWKDFVAYFNDIPPCQFLVRKDARNILHIPNNTFDAYRRILQANNIIDYVNDGTYFKCHEIPENMSLSELRLRGYGSKEKYIRVLEGTAKFPTVHYKLIQPIEPNPVYKKKSNSIFDI
jgi:hypothetical protein